MVSSSSAPYFRRIFSVHAVHIYFFKCCIKLTCLAVCNRYALDWLHSEGVVRVLCGSQSQITCTLKLHDDYPSVSSVTLQSATGLPPDFNLDTIQVK